MNEKLYNGIMGLITGEMVGLPYRRKERGTVHADFNNVKLSDTWSESGALTLATMDAYVKNKGKYGNMLYMDILHSFAMCYVYGTYTTREEAPEISRVTEGALNTYISGITDLDKIFGTDEYDNDNGALLRILPLAYTGASEIEIEYIAGLTHGNVISLYACKVYIRFAQKLLRGLSVRDAYEELLIEMDCGAFKQEQPKEFEYISKLNYISYDEIRNSSFIVDTLEVAIWCLLTTDNYTDCILRAVNLGGDTSAMAAAAGGLAGIVYGINDRTGIPQAWIQAIPQPEFIKQHCDKFSKYTIKPTGKKHRIPVRVREWIYTILGVAVVMGIIAAANIYLFQFSRISGTSMQPTLTNNDIVLVMKKAGYEPKQGDIVMFNADFVKDAPSAKSIYYVKRIIATEGQEVNVHDGHVYVDGEQVNDSFGNTYITDSRVQYPITVSENHVFVLGDNRGNSHDSRSSDVGQVPEDKIIGRVLFRLLPYNKIGSVA